MKIKALAAGMGAAILLLTSMTTPLHTYAADQGSQVVLQTEISGNSSMTNNNGAVVELADGSTVSVSGEAVQNGLLFLVERITAESGTKTQYDSITTAMKDKGSDQRIYDLCFIDSKGQTVQPKGQMTVAISLNGQYTKPCIYYVAGDMSTILMTSTVANDTISFVTDHNSYYVLAESKSGSSNNNGGGSGGGGSNGGGSSDDGDYDSGNRPTHSETTSTTETPVTPVIPVTSATPETSVTPETPATPETPVTPVAPGQPTQTNQPDKIENTPTVPTGPYVEGQPDHQGWENVITQIDQVKTGDTITVDMNGTTTVSADVLDSLRGKDVTIVFDLGGGITWSVNGESITSDNLGDIDFGVSVDKKTIPVNIINNVTGERYSMEISIAYDGEFGFTAVLSVNLDAKNAGLYANLFYYAPEATDLEFICASLIDDTGIAQMEFTHASDYVIVVDQESMEPKEAVAKADTEGSTEGSTDTEVPAETNAGTDTAETAKTGTPQWLLWGSIILAVLMAGFVIVLVRGKKKMSDQEK